MGSPGLEDIVARQRLGEIMIEILLVETGPHKEIYVIQPDGAREQMVLQRLAGDRKAVKQNRDHLQLHVFGVSRQSKIESGVEIVFLIGFGRKSVAGRIVSEVVIRLYRQRKAEVIPVPSFVVVSLRTDRALRYSIGHGQPPLNHGTRYAVAVTGQLPTVTGNAMAACALVRFR